MSHIRAFFKKEPVLSIAAAAAALSMLLVPPSPAYIDYIDVRVLCLLFCLMAVVAGLQRCGLFELLSRRLLGGSMSLRRVVILLVLLPFFSSMLVTNDVALITFVPFALLVLDTIGRRDQAIFLVALQTAAANLGSMATPVGNPQNLFLYANYQLNPGSFFALMVPLTLASLVLLLLLTLRIGADPIRVSFADKVTLRRPRLLPVYGALFLLCLLSVFRVVHYGLLTVIVAAAFLLLDREVLRRVDYGLLVTFVCFFIFAGNIGCVDAVRRVLSALLERSTLLSSALASQVISNVPAAVLLAGFTDHWQGLLAGVNIGGLGTLIASLASLISFKYYAAEADARPGRYLAVFTAVNLLGLAVLLPLALLLI